MTGERSRLHPLVLAAIALALAVGAVVLLSIFGGDDGTAPPPVARPAHGTSAARVGARPGDGLLTPAPAEYRALIGRTAQGRGTIVESVVAGAGFWIGPNRSKRVFVRTPAGAYVPVRRSHVDIDGTIVAATAATARALRLDAADRSSLRRVGALIAARTVRPG